MGYSMVIGNAGVSKQGILRSSFTVVERTHPDAPLFAGDETTGQSNTRLPSYSGWRQFCQATGLFELFYHKKLGLLREHPGCFGFSTEHLAVVEQALTSWQVRYPEAVPQFDDEPKNGHLARLLWLVWWMRYSLEHDRFPSVSNS